jgi:solute carrier family 45 protein 1/2/4
MPSRYTQLSIHNITCLNLFRLTIGLAGLQFIWTVEMGYGTPYLSSLGLSKPLLGLVWLAGPLSGLIVQPLIGAMSDRSHSRFGRRRPFIFVSSLIVLFSICLVGYPVEILAIFGFFILDFSINAVQAMLRSLIVDVLPSNHQNNGNTWASIMIGLGNIAGYLMGFIDLRYYFSFLGSSQFKILITISSIVFAASILITCLFTQETPNDRLNINEYTAGCCEPFRHIYYSLKNLPKFLMIIFATQFFSWIGWFPFLFYSTEFIKEVTIEKNASNDETYAVRLGFLGLLLFSLVSIVVAFVLPHIMFFFKIRMHVIWVYGQIIFSLLMLSSFLVKNHVHSIIIVAAVGISWAISLWVPVLVLLIYSLHWWQNL